MTRGIREVRAVALALVLLSLVLAVPASAAGAKLGAQWMRSYRAPGTPARYDKVGVIKIGAKRAKNVLVLEPGTSAGGGYFVPLAKWIVSRAPGWQVWSVERRENLLEDHSMLNRAKDGKANANQLFAYYLGFLANSSVKHHIQLIPDSKVGFARQWGMKVAVEDLHTVIAAARKRGGKVVLGGHSLGGSVVTAYATWNFHGKPGADQLAGLIYDDGGSLGTTESAPVANKALHALSTSTPWLAFSGVPAPFLGLFSAVGSTVALIAPNQLSQAETFSLTPSVLEPPLAATNLAVFGYDTDTQTSKLDFAAQAHLGHLDTSVSPARWDQAGEISPIRRYAGMLSGTGVTSVDGTEWYFPQRLTDDTAAVDQGNANPAQKVLDLQATLGHKLPRTLRIYAFGAYGGTAITNAAAALAKQSHIPMRNLTLVSRHGTYAHNDPAAAYPKNAFFSHLIPFLSKLG
jgi:triacylglycerol esterase/lipase EstA (alpha/beta hydrolase family)